MVLSAVGLFLKSQTVIRTDIRKIPVGAPLGGDISETGSWDTIISPWDINRHSVLYDVQFWWPCVPSTYVQKARQLFRKIFENIAPVVISPKS